MKDLKPGFGRVFYCALFVSGTTPQPFGDYCRPDAVMARTLPIIFDHCIKNSGIKNSTD